MLRHHDCNESGRCALMKRCAKCIKPWTTHVHMTYMYRAWVGQDLALQITLEYMSGELVL